MCVFLGRAMNFFWPQSRGAIAPLAPPWIRHWYTPYCYVSFVTFCAKILSRTVLSHRLSVKFALTVKKFFSLYAQLALCRWTDALLYLLCVCSVIKSHTHVAVHLYVTGLPHTQSLLAWTLILERSRKHIWTLSAFSLQAGSLLLFVEYCYEYQQQNCRMQMYILSH